MEHIEDFSDLGVVLPIKEKKERTELQKLNDAKTSQRMKEWHQKRREEKAKRKEALDKAIADTVEEFKKKMIKPNVIIKQLEEPQEIEPIESEKIVLPHEPLMLDTPKALSPGELKGLPCERCIIEPIEPVAELKPVSMVKKMINKIENKERKPKGKPIIIEKNIIECFDSE